MAPLQKDVPIICLHFFVKLTIIERIKGVLFTPHEFEEYLKENGRNAFAFFPQKWEVTINATRVNFERTKVLGVF